MPPPLTIVTINSIATLKGVLKLQSPEGEDEELGGTINDTVEDAVLDAITAEAEEAVRSSSFGTAFCARTWHYDGLFSQTCTCCCVA